MGKLGKWQLESKRVVFGKDGKFTDPETEEELKTWGVQVLRKDYIDPNGNKQTYIVSGGETLNWSMVFPLTNDLNVILIKEYQQGTGRIEIGLPAGVKSSGESFRRAAARELIEETGYYSDPDLFIQLSPPLSISTRKSETHFIPFLATGVKKVAEPKPDSTEHIEVILVSLTEFLSMIERGEVRNSNVISTTFLALLHLKKV